MRRKVLWTVLMTAAGMTMNMTAGADGTDQYVYTTLNIPYADFYYGELNDVEPEEPGEAVEPQFSAEDAVTAAGYREEGIYDAVTSATNQKSTRFAGAYTEENGEGVNILGPAHVNVAISKGLYDNVKQAIEEGSECSNPLLDFVKETGEVSDTAPAEYKVLNSDGTFSRTVGNQVVAEDVQASISTVSRWGNYGITVQGAEIDADAVQGAILTTSDGARYGLEHEDNLWLRPDEMAFAVEAFTEPHGNEIAYRRFEDLQGKTITKITYLLADQDDLVVETELFCKRLLGEGEGLTGPESIPYSTDGTVITLEMTRPEGSAYTLGSVTGKEVLDERNYTLEGNVLTLGAACRPGFYTITYTDSNFADAQAKILVNSNLEEGSVSIENNAVTVAENGDGITAPDYTANISSVLLNGEPVSGKKVGAIIFDEAGNVNTDAELTDREGNTVPLFPEEGEYTIEVASDGYPSASGTVIK